MCLSKFNKNSKSKFKFTRALVNHMKKLKDISYTTEKVYVIYICRIICRITYYTKCIDKNIISKLIIYFK